MNRLQKPLKGSATKARRKKTRVKRQMQSDNRIACFERDRGRCRACYTPGLQLQCVDPFLVFHAHHIKNRSLGGPDTLDNLIGTCVRCHHRIHQRELSVVGDPNGIVVFREYEKWTRELLRKWESVL